MPLSTEAVNNVKAILDGTTADPKAGVPGLFFVAVDKQGKTLIEHSSGTRGIESKEPVDADTTFWMASMTKVVTTIAVLQLTEQGKLSLDDPEVVKKLAPEIGKKKVLYDGVNTAEQERPITIRMLLSHTAGFGYSFFDPRVIIQDRPIGIEEFHGDEKDITESPLLNQPGTMFEYGINLDWAGILVERATGLKLGDYFQKYIFEPLGVQSSSMFPSEEMQKNLAHMHQRGGDGNIVYRDHLYRRAFRADTEEQKKLFFQSGGAGLFSKPTEYIKILAALLNDGTSPTTGGKILTPDTIKLMWENQIPDQPNFARGGPPPPKPDLANHAPEMYPQAGNPPQGWGLSFFLTIAPGETGRGANTAWWAGIANTFYWIDREKGVAGVIASQVLPFGDPKVIPTWFAAEKAVYDGLQN